MMFHAVQNQPVEFSLVSDRSYPDPFNEVELDVIFTTPAGRELRVPAFWSGDRLWRVRFASPEIGRHEFRSECSDAANPGLHGLSGVVEVVPYEGENPLFRHGPLRVSADRRYLEHRDGAPFFWLGDTWWMGLCRRLAWPDEFRRLAEDRAGKGFSVIQIVAGLYPDMAAFDPRGKNEAGFPWKSGFSCLDPAYFDMADLRIEFLVRRGLVPCIVGCWGYYLRWLGIEKMKRHWRYLIARWGALPVVWCLAGEGTMPYYLSETPDADREFQKRGWTELARYVRNVDPWERPLTIHPSASARESVDDPAVLDFDMLQTGHGDRRSLPGTVRAVTAARAAEPRMPVIEGEVCYEGIGGQCREEVQRLMFWASMLSGASGFTYGANGIWQVNRREAPYGPSPHGMAWGHTPWEEAAALPGSGQLGRARRLLERYPWWEFEPHPEWIEPNWTSGDFLRPYGAGIPGKVRIFYWPCMWEKPRIKGLEPGIAYRAFLVDPAKGDEIDLGRAAADSSGDWRLPLARLPIYQDWLLVLDAVSES